MLNILNNEDISVLERQIEQLIEFKPVPEHEIKILCEKVSKESHHYPSIRVHHCVINCCGQ